MSSSSLSFLFAFGPIFDRGLGLARQFFASQDENAKLRRAAALAFLIRVASAGLAYLSQIFLARLLGPFEYGIFAYVAVWIIILGHTACFGFGQSIIRFIPRYIEKSRPDRLLGYVRFSLLIAVFGALLLAGLGVAGLQFFSHHLENYYVLPLYLALLVFPLFALQDMLEGLSRGFGWVNLALAPPYLVRPALVIVGLLIAVLLGAPATAATAVTVSIGAALVSLLVQAFLVWKRMHKEAPKAVANWRQPKFWLLAAFPLILADSFYLLQTYADLFVLNLYVTPDRLAIYFATVKTVGLVSFIHYGVAAATQQKFASYHTAGEHEKLRRFVANTSQWTFWPAVAAALGLLAMGYPLLWMFGESFTEGYPLMFILAAGIVAHASTGQAEFLLNMLGHQSKVALVLGVTLLSNLSLNFLLVPVWGLYGAAIATSITLTLQGLFYAFVAKRLENIETRIWLLPHRIEG